MTQHRTPANLSDFQREMYCHLIDWKRRHITEKPGRYAGREYDAIFPDEFKRKLSHLDEPVRQRFFDPFDRCDREADYATAWKVFNDRGIQSQSERGT